MVLTKYLKNGTRARKGFSLFTDKINIFIEVVKT